MCSTLQKTATQWIQKLWGWPMPKLKTVETHAFKVTEPVPVSIRDSSCLSNEPIFSLLIPTETSNRYVPWRKQEWFSGLFHDVWWCVNDKQHGIGRRRGLAGGGYGNAQRYQRYDCGDTVTITIMTELILPLILPSIASPMSTYRNFKMFVQTRLAFSALSSSFYIENLKVNDWA